MFSKNGRSSGAAASSQKPLAAFMTSQARPSAVRTTLASRVPATPARVAPPSSSQYADSATRQVPAQRNAPAPPPPSSLARGKAVQAQQAESYRVPSSQTPVRARVPTPRAQAATIQHAQPTIIRPPVYIPSPAPTVSDALPTSEYRPASAARAGAISAMSYRPTSAASQVGSEMHIVGNQPRPPVPGQASNMIMGKLNEMNAALLARLDAQAAEVNVLRQDVVLLQHANAQLISAQPPDMLDFRETVQNLVVAQSADGAEIKSLIQDLRGQVHDLHQEVKALPTKDEAAEEIASQLAPALNDAVEAIKHNVEASLVTAMDGLSLSMPPKVKAHIDRAHSGLVKILSASHQEASTQVRELGLRFSALEASLGPTMDLFAKSEVHAALEQLPAAVVDVAAFREALALLAGKVEEHSMPTSSAGVSDLIPACSNPSVPGDSVAMPSKIVGTPDLSPATAVDLTQVLHMLHAIREDLAQVPHVVTGALTNVLPAKAWEILPALKRLQDGMDTLKTRHVESPCAQLDFQADLFQIQDMFNDVSKAQTAITDLMSPLANDISKLATHISDTKPQACLDTGPQLCLAGPPTPMSAVMDHATSPDFQGIESITSSQSPSTAATAKRKAKSKSKARAKSKRHSKSKSLGTANDPASVPVDPDNKSATQTSNTAPLANAASELIPHEDSSAAKQSAASKKRSSPPNQTASFSRRIVPPRAAKAKNQHCPPGASQTPPVSTSDKPLQGAIERCPQSQTSLRQKTPNSQCFRSERTREAAQNLIRFQAIERAAGSQESDDSVKFVGTKRVTTSHTPAPALTRTADDEVDSLCSRTSRRPMQSLLEPSPPPALFPPSELRRWSAPRETSSHQGAFHTSAQTLRDRPKDGEDEDSTEVFPEVRQPPLGDKSFTTLRRLKRRSEELQGNALRVKRTIFA